MKVEAPAPAVVKIHGSSDVPPQIAIDVFGFSSNRHRCVWVVLGLSSTFRHRCLWSGLLSLYSNTLHRSRVASPCSNALDRSRFEFQLLEFREEEFDDGSGFWSFGKQNPTTVPALELGEAEFDDSSSFWSFGKQNSTTWLLLPVLIR